MNKIKTLLKSSPWIITFIYLIVGFIWIAFSDQWVLSIFEDPETITRVQSQKGFFFVAASALLIFLLIRKSNSMLGSVISNLDRSNKKFEATFNHTPVGIAHHHNDETWIDANQTLCTMLGYSRDEIMKIKFEDAIHSDDLDKGRNLDLKLLNGELSHYEIEKRYIRKDGSGFPALLRKSAVFNNGDSSVRYLISVVEDISKQKEFEREIKQSLQEKEMLLAEVHHRVKNNLALITALFELQIMYSNNDEISETLGNSKIRIKCLSMVHETFSGSSSGAEVDFSSNLQEITKFIDFTFGLSKQGVAFRKKIEPVQLNINQAIPVSLIVTELMINIHRDKFSDTDHPEIDISLSINDNSVSLEISDNGKGLFERNQVESPDTLAFIIVKTLVSQIEGDLQIVPEEEGTRYKLHFTKSDKLGAGSSWIDK